MVLNAKVYLRAHTAEVLNVPECTVLGGLIRRRLIRKLSEFAFPWLRELVAQVAQCPAGQRAKRRKLVRKLSESKAVDDCAEALNISTSLARSVFRRLANLKPRSIEKLERRLAAKPPSNARVRPEKLPKLALAFDTETSVYTNRNRDSSQRLTFGLAYLLRLRRGKYVVHESITFYAEDLVAVERDTLRDYAKVNGWTFCSREEFVERYFWRAVRAGALIISFNLPWDLSRIAVETAWSAKAGGRWSLVLSQHKEKGKLVPGSLYRPNITVKLLDKGQIIGLTHCEANPYPPLRAVDLAKLAYALTGRHHSLRSLCESLKVQGVAQKLDHKPTGCVTPEEITYCERDVQCVVGAANALLTELVAHSGVALLPEGALSVASFPRAYYEAMGLHPPAEKFDLSPEVQGIAMGCLYGGRGEARLIREPMPVVLVDYLSQYATGSVLLGLFYILRAKNLRLVEVGDEELRQLQELLDSASPNTVRDRAFWERLLFIAEILPDGDILPVRAKFGIDKRINLGVDPFRSDEPILYAGPHLVAAALLNPDHKVPKLRRAWKVVAEGVQDGLKPVALHGSVHFDPRTEDFNKVVVEQRFIAEAQGNKELKDFLKIFASAAASGLFMEVHDESVGRDYNSRSHGKATVSLCSNGKRLRARAGFIERPGHWYAPLIASFVTAGGQLLLALAEHLVKDAGAEFVFCDTDSLCVVSSERGGLVECEGGRELNGKSYVRELSWEELQRKVISPLASLNPFSPDAVPDSILRSVDVNHVDRDPSKPWRQLYCYALSTKRYCIYRLDGEGRPVPVKLSAHSLHLVDPMPGCWNEEAQEKQWLVEVWKFILSRELGLPYEAPRWMDSPALIPTRVTTREEWRALGGDQKKRPYAMRAKPFNFGWQAIPRDPFGSEVVPIAPSTLDLANWRGLPWRDRTTGKPLLLAVEDWELDSGAGKVLVHTYRSYIERFQAHPEDKSLAPNGEPVTAQTKGLLRRRPVVATGIGYVPKETKRTFQLADGSSVTELGAREYETGKREDTPGVAEARELLKQFKAGDAARASGKSIRTIKRYRNGRSTPGPETVAAILRMAGGNDGQEKQG